ncbi:MAG TPA: hypothetical protein VK646_09555 [Actinomycetota bacterium]|nr:hypothetical protein [Actinomycetota bacterium]
MRSKPLLLLLSAAVLAGATVAPSIPVRAVPVEGTSCEVFPSDNVWHLNVSKLPVNRKSATWKKAMHAGSTNLHPDFGPPSYGIPFDVVGAAHPTVTVHFQYASESDHAPYPFGADTHIEGGSDRHAIMLDQSDCTLYELYAARWNGGSPTAGSGAIFHLTGANANKLRPAGWTSADAAGLPIFAGLLRYDEVAAGVVDHAIRMTSDCTSNAYVWPARHRAGSGGANCPPMGARFRLKAGFDIKRFGPMVQVVLRAMKRYGLIVADNGSDWYFQGTVDPRWTYNFVDQLKRIPAGAFVAVDASRCRVAGGSARFAYGPGCPKP